MRRSNFISGLAMTASVLIYVPAHAQNSWVTPAASWSSV